jgi:hypothetical protein
MAKAFASSRNAISICDRCGFTYPLRELRKETRNSVLTNVKVCPECFDPDHPQYKVGKRDYSDPQALRDPRPDLNTGTGRIDRYRTASSGDEFNGSADGWAIGDANTTLTLNDTYLTVDSIGPYSSTGIHRRRTGTPLDIDASVYKFVRAKIRIVNLVTPIDWLGLLMWLRTTDSSTSASRFSYVSVPEHIGQFGEQWHMLEWDMTDETNWTGTIDGVTLKTIYEYGTVIDYAYIRFESK